MYLQMILTFENRFARNVFWNLIGAGFPMLATLYAVPHLIHAIGATKFGLLALVWMIVGYFSLFDLGLGRAVTQIVAMRNGARDEETTRVVWTALLLMSCLGIAGGVASAAAAPLGVGRYLAIPETMRNETVTAMLLAAAAIPLVVLTTGLRGLLEGHQRFDIVNALRAPLSSATIVGPLFLLPYTHQLPGLVAALVAVRLVGCVLHLLVCGSLFPELRHAALGSGAELRYLLSFGSWLTISNIVSPLLMYAVRIALAVMVSGASVAYFSTPNDIVGNFQIIPSIIATVLYPQFSTLISRNKPEARALYIRANLLVACVTLPICGGLLILAYPMLNWWIGADFADHSAVVCQLLTIGIFFNGFAFLSEAVIQGSGRPDLTAKLNLIELAVYIPYLYFFIGRYGVVGAAVAWTLRILFSTVVQVFLVNRCLAPPRLSPRTAFKEELS